MSGVFLVGDMMLMCLANCETRDSIKYVRVLQEERGCWKTMNIYKKYDE